MNPLTQIKNTQKVNRAELAAGYKESASWHARFKHSAYIFAGGLDFDLTEGDLLAVFAQYGEIVDVHLARDQNTGRSRGFGFMAYEDQRSTVLAVDNLNGAKVAGRIVRVEHVDNYKKRKAELDGEKYVEDGSGPLAVETAPAAFDRRGSDPSDDTLEGASRFNGNGKGLPGPPKVSAEPWAQPGSIFALMEEARAATAAGPTGRQASSVAAPRVAHVEGSAEGTTKEKKHKKDKEKKHKHGDKAEEKGDLAIADARAMPPPPARLPPPPHASAPPAPAGAKPASALNPGNSKASFGPPRPPPRSSGDDGSSKHRSAHLAEPVVGDRDRSTSEAARPSSSFGPPRPPPTASAAASDDRGGSSRAGGARDTNHRQRHGSHGCEGDRDETEEWQHDRGGGRREDNNPARGSRPDSREDRGHDASPAQDRGLDRGRQEGSDRGRHGSGSYDRHDVGRSNGHASSGDGHPGGRHREREADRDAHRQEHSKRRQSRSRSRSPRRR